MEQIDSDAAMLNILGIVLCVGAMIAALVYIRYRDPIGLLSRAYACEQHFDGILVECYVSFPISEAKTHCALGATREGLYMSPPIGRAEAKSSMPWLQGGYPMRAAILIPWDQLHYRRAGFPLHKQLRFDVPSINATFFVLRTVGEPLLERAGRRIS
jgi:hypothetical protein